MFTVYCTLNTYPVTYYRCFFFVETQDWSNGISEEGKIPYIIAKSLDVKQDRMIVANFALHIRAGTSFTFTFISLAVSLAR